MMDLWLFSGTKLRTKFDTIRARERRLKAGKMLQWSILSKSPSSCAAKVSEDEAPWMAPEANEDGVPG